jgi:ATP-dependent Clp protease ATP-binding subunit ClpA
MIFNRFAREARCSVEAAVEEARMLGHDSLGDEDLLLGILRADAGIAAEALFSLGVTLEDARDESEAMFAGALASVGISLEEVRREAGKPSICGFRTNAASLSPRGRKRSWSGRSGGR